MSLLGKKLTHLRKKVGLTQLEVANHLHIDRSTYAYYETGSSSPSVNLLLPIARLYGVPADFLIDDEQPVFHSSYRFYTENTAEPALENVNRAVLELAILSLLKKEDMHGPQLSRAIEEKSNGMYAVKEWFLYPALHWLGKRDRISSREEEKHIYYHLTPIGSAYLDELLREYTFLYQGITQIIKN